MTEKPHHSVLPADEVGLAFDETSIVAVPSGDIPLPGMVLVATGVVPSPQGEHEHVLCERACDVDPLDEAAQFCVCLESGTETGEYRLVRVAPLKPAETILVRADSPVREGTLLSRAVRSGSGMYRSLDGRSLGPNEVLYVAAGDGVLLAPGTTQVRAHRVSRQLGAQVARIVAGLNTPAQSAPRPETNTRQPAPHDAPQPEVQVLMLDAEAERTKPGMPLVWRGDVRFYGGRTWHVYVRENEYNKSYKHKLVATGAPPTPAPEDYLRVVTALGTLPPERRDILSGGDDGDGAEDKFEQTPYRAGTDDVRLLEQAATPEAPSNLVQTEAADALVAAMRDTDPRRTSAMEAARRLLAIKDLNVHVLARLTAGLAEQGATPSVAYELARSETTPWRRAAAAFLLPVDHLPFLRADPDENVQQAARLAADPGRLRARAGRAGVTTAVRAAILRAASVDDSSAIETLASLWGEHPEPPEKIDEALRALVLTEDEEDEALSGLGREDAADAEQALSRLWERDSSSTGSFDEIRVAEAGCSHVETDPKRLATLVEGMRAEEALLKELGEYPLTDGQPTEFDPLAKVGNAARDGRDPQAVDKFVRRHARPVKPGEPTVDQVLARDVPQRCPVCGGKLGRRVDPRQSGVGCEPGEQWVNYRCSQDPSHLVVDRPEPIHREAASESRGGLPSRAGGFEQLGWPRGEVVVIEGADPTGLHNTLLLRYDWRQESGAVLPVCRVACGGELPPGNIEDLWIAHGLYARGVDGRHYVHAVNIAARPDGGPSVLDAIDRSAIRDDLGWAEQLIALGVRVQVDPRRLQEETRWPVEDIEQRKRIMRLVSQVTRSVVVGEPVGVALGLLACLHASWAGVLGGIAVVPADARVEPGLLLRRVGWRRVGNILSATPGWIGDPQTAPECVVALASDLEDVTSYDLLVATGITATFVAGGDPLLLARVHRGNDIGFDQIEAALRGTKYPLERVSRLKRMGVIVRSSAEPAAPAPAITTREERAMDAVFGAPETRTVQPARGIGTQREVIAPPPGLEAQAQAVLTAARRTERVRSVGLGRGALVGWSASGDQGMSVPNPELLRRVDPNDMQGNDGPLGVDADDPEVKQLGRSLWGDEDKIVLDASKQEAQSEQQLADLIDHNDPDAVTSVPEIPNVQAEDAHTFGLIDRAIEAAQRQTLTERVKTREREVIAIPGDDPSEAGQQTQDAAAMLAGTGASS